MKCSDLISELSRQMARSGDLEVEVEGEGLDDLAIEDVVRIGDGPILICTL